MKMLLISAGAVAALALSTPAFAANNTATANATVNIVSPLTLTNDNGLDFGTIVGPFNGEVVEVATDGSRNCGGLTCSGTTVSAANFTVKDGTPSQNLKLTVDPSVDLTSGTNKLTVDLTTDLPTGLVTDASGGAKFGVGGSLTIPSGTVDGVYSGTFNVQVDYE
jgi:hypothetical protein